MISDSGTVKFMIVDTPSHTSLFLLHKPIGASQEDTIVSKIIYRQLLQSLNFYDTMTSSTEISSMSTLLPKEEGAPKSSSENTRNFLNNKIVPMPEFSKGGY